MDINQVKNFLAMQHIDPKKELGQNFLVNDQVVVDIINQSHLVKYDNIFEIGPGLGILSAAIVAMARPDQKVFLIEIDPPYYQHNKKLFASYDNVEVIQDDFLRYQCPKFALTQKNLWISNLPYSITSLAVLKFLQSDGSNHFVCMLQKEAADHFLAKVNSKKYNSLSVLVQYYCEVIKILDVPKQDFYPVPQVDSVVVTFTKKTNLKFDLRFSKFIQHCFRFRRKTLINNLKDLYPISKLSDYCQKQKGSLTIRPQELDCHQILQLYQSL